MNSNNGESRKVVSIVAGILTFIPFLFLIMVSTYVKTQPEIGGLPFFYWYQMLWLFLAALLFFIAAVLWNRYGGE